MLAAVRSRRRSLCWSAAACGTQTPEFAGSERRVAGADQLIACPRCSRGRRSATACRISACRAWATGPDIRLADLRGPLVINVWAQWCGPCREEAPYLAELQKQGRRQASSCSASTTSTRGRELAVKFALEQRARPTRTWSTAEKLVQQPLKVGGPPLTVFVDKDGKVVYVHRGVLTSQQRARPAGEGQTGGRPVTVDDVRHRPARTGCNRLRTASERRRSRTSCRGSCRPTTRASASSAVLILLADGNDAATMAPTYCSPSAPGRCADTPARCPSPAAASTPRTAPASTD